MRTITIGRDNSCDIVINHDRVSRFHANMTRNGDGFTYRDMSSNGTLINGVLLRNGDKYIHYGEQVLLAGNIPLPWNKVQQLSQVHGGGGPYEGRNYPKEEEQDIPYYNGTGLIVFGYIFALLAPLFAFIFSSILLNSTMVVDGKRVKKYKPSSRTHGSIITGIAIVAACIYILIRVANS